MNSPNGKIAAWFPKTWEVPEVFTKETKGDVKEAVADRMKNKANGIVQTGRLASLKGLLWRGFDM